MRELNILANCYLINQGEDRCVIIEPYTIPMLSSSQPEETPGISPFVHHG